MLVVLDSHPTMAPDGCGCNVFFRRLLFDLGIDCRLTWRQAGIFDLGGGYTTRSLSSILAEEHWRASAAHPD